MTVRALSPIRIATGVCLLLAVAAFVVSSMRTAGSVLHGSWSGDFPNYYFPGRHVLDGSSPYRRLDLDVRAGLGVSYMEKYPADTPATLILLSPLALLPFRVAWFAMAVLSIAIVVGVMWSVCRSVGLTRVQSATVATLSLVTYPGRAILYYGHMEALVLLTGYLGWRACVLDREPAAGVWWALAASLKLFPGTWVLGLVAGRRWRAVAAAGVTCVIIALASIASIGWDACWFFATRVLAQSTDWAEAVGNLSLLGVGGGLGGRLAGWLAEIGIGVGLLVAFVRNPGGADRTWCAGTVLALLLSPLAWVFYHLLAFPGLVLLGSHVHQGRTWLTVRFLALVAVITMWPAFIDTGVESLTRLSAAVRPLGLLAMFGWCMTAMPPSADDSFR
jgi:alpha-1,2-mannosyltransferase